jgi:hypothetical protein
VRAPPPRPLPCSAEKNANRNVWDFGNANRNGWESSSRGRFATPADSPLQDCIPYSHDDAKVWDLFRAHIVQAHFPSPRAQTRNFVSSLHAAGLLPRRSAPPPWLCSRCWDCFRCKNILVATGGRAFKPDIPGKELCITSDEALNLPAMPQKIAIVGSVRASTENPVEFQGTPCGSETRTEIPMIGIAGLHRAGVRVHLQATGRRGARVLPPAAAAAWL